MAEGAAVPPWRTRLAAVLGGVAAASAAFLAVTALLLAANHLRSREARPLDPSLLEPLRQELARAPRDGALRERYRALDRVARQAHFSSVALDRSGAFLLLGGAVVLLSALKGRAALLPGGRERRPPPGSAGAAARERDRARVVLLAGGGAAALLLLVLTARYGPLPGGDGARDRWGERFTHWPAFRGADGRARSDAPLPVDGWDGTTGRNVLWKVPVPRPGFGSPVAWGGRLFLTGGDASARELFCFDGATGALRWRRAVGGFPGSPAAPPATTPDTGVAASTPATDGLRVFAVFATGDLAAFDFEGNRLWGRHLGVPANPYGHASSLLVWKDLLIVPYDHGGGGRLVAVRCATGETAWERERPVQPSWASPVLVEAGGRTHLVLNGNPFVIGYDPRTGAELWRVECMGGELAPSPAAEGGTVFVANQYARLAAIRIGAGEASKAWEWTGDLPDVSSPLASGGRLLLPTGFGVVTCFDGASGKVLWKADFPTGFYSSPVAAAGRIVLVDRSGLARVIEDGPAYRLLAECPLGEPCGATPAIAGGRLYLRGESHLFCIAPTPGGTGAPGGAAP